MSGRRAVTVSGQRLRERRTASGLTQAQLAARAGVSRQLVAAVESGRNVPAVDAALALAVALGCTVEELFGPPEAGPEVSPALEGERLEGAAVRVGRVGERLVAAAPGDHGAAGPGWATTDGVVVDGRLSLFSGAAPAGLVLAGCEPALAVAERLLAGLGERSLLAVSASTGAAVKALREGRLHGAVVHGPSGSLEPAPEWTLRWHFAAWQVGLGCAASIGNLTVDDLLHGSIPIVQRDPSAASQQALLRALARRGGGRPPPGPVASGHLEAARAAATLRCAAVTTEAAARAFGLPFVALEEHEVQLWIDRRWAQHPGVQALGDLIRSRGFQQRVSSLGGYDLSRCGDALGA
ncbi:MAG TPA: helix-turn-helix domain-containing protein [Solirubrobacteraceae bacterium]|nr:helix-turn-helix domain-containing protein [Solirubrobacteraceae bacterium]